MTAQAFGWACLSGRMSSTAKMVPYGRTQSELQKSHRQGLTFFPYLVKRYRCPCPSLVYLRIDMKRAAKRKSGKNLDVRNCICGRRPELNHAITAGHHPDRFELKAGAICFVVVTGIVYLVNPIWALWPFVILLIVALLAGVAKTLHGHTLACAARDGLLIGIAFFANVLEALNPGNWI